MRAPRPGRLGALLALAILAVAPAAGAQTYPGLQGTACWAGTMLRPASYASANSTNTAQALPSLHEGSVLAIVTVTSSAPGGSIRYRDDAGTPTATAGMPASPTATTSGGTVTLAVCQPQLEDFRYVSGPNGGARIDALYYVR